MQTQKLLAWLSIFSICIVLVTIMSCADPEDASLVTGTCKFNSIHAVFNPNPVTIVAGESAEIEVDASVQANCEDIAEYFYVSSDRVELCSATADNNEGRCAFTLDIPINTAPGNLAVEYLIRCTAFLDGNDMEISDHFKLDIIVISATQDFTLSADPDNLSIEQGATGTVEITIDRAERSDAILLTAEGNIIGDDETQVQAGFYPNPATGDQAILTLQAGEYAHVGTHPITILGTAGDIEKTTDISLTVTPFEEPWKLQSFQQFNRLYGVHFTDVDNGYAVGESGTIVKTTDGGENWLKLDEVTSVHLNEVWFFSESTGFVVGDNKTLLYTTDGGNTWTDTLSNEVQEQYFFKSLYFLNEQKGWIVGSSVNQTMNGGLAWEQQLAYEDGRYWEDISFGSTTNGVIVGRKMGATGDIFYTSDGLAWLQSNYPAEILELHGVWFINSTTVFAVGYGGMILKSNDGGANWVLLTSQAGLYHYSVSFGDEENGWIGSDGIYRTTDGGDTWIDEELITYSIRDIYFLNAETGYAVGQGGAIWRRK